MYKFVEEIENHGKYVNEFFFYINLRRIEGGNILLYVYIHVEKVCLFVYFSDIRYPFIYTYFICYKI